MSEAVLKSRAQKNSEELLLGDQTFTTITNDISGVPRLLPPPLPPFTPPLFPSHFGDFAPQAKIFGGFDALRLLPPPLFPSHLKTRGG